MTREELQTLVEDEIASCLGHIKRGESVIFYEGKLSGLTLMREKMSLLTQRVPDVCPVCTGKGQFTNFQGLLIKCSSCNGTGQRG